MLTDIQLRNAKPREKTYKLYDIDGLYIQIPISGRKRWRFKYWIGKDEKSLSLGIYPDVGLKEAREERDKLRALVANGQDPSLLRKQEKHRLSIAATNTFRLIARAWWEKWKHDKVESTYREVWSRLENHIFPELGNVPVDQLTTLQFVQTFQIVEAKGLTDVARRCVQLCRQIMRFARVNGFVLINVLADVEPSDFLKAYKKTNFARVSIQELPDLIKKIWEYDGNFHTRMGLKLMLYTFVRTSELIETEPDEFDFKDALWRIPACRMKMAGYDHLVPLSRQSLAIVQEIMAVNGDRQYLFPGEGRARTMSNNTILYALYRMGYRSRMTGHGFRGVASTQLHEMDFPAEHIELQLAHLPRKKVAAAYNHAKYLAQRRVMMQSWADYVDGLIDG